MSSHDFSDVNFILFSCAIIFLFKHIFQQISLQLSMYHQIYSFIVIFKKSFILSWYNEKTKTREIRSHHFKKSRFSLFIIDDFDKIVDIWSINDIFIVRIKVEFRFYQINELRKVQIIYCFYLKCTFIASKIFWSNN